MRKLKISTFDVKYYFYRNKNLIFSFLFCFLVGLIIGIFIVISSDSYLSLATSENKILYSIINGTASTSAIFWNYFLKIFLSMIIIFLLNLNFYIGILSFVFITYQSALFVMSMASIVSLYGLSGIINILFCLIPINLISLIILIFFCVVCLSRSYEAQKNHQIFYGISSYEFLTKVGFTLLLSLVLCFVSSVIYPLILKSIIYIIF